MKHPALALLVVLAAACLPACAAVRSLAGPSPELAAAAPDIAAGLQADSAAHPERKERNDRALDALDAAVDTKRRDAAVETIGILGTLFGTPAGLGAVTAVLGVLGLWGKSRKTDAAVGTVATVVDQHAGLIDAHTPAEAEWAATVGPKPPASS